VCLTPNWCPAYSSHLLLIT